jgi:2-polyprenyl-3-methyl-5-hydroxy-6-metoxy-1,4-benzoquinol methylase
MMNQGDMLSELFRAAVAQHQAGALAEAERRYRYILKQFSGHAETHSRLGAVLMAQGKTQEAIGAMERALELQPNLFEAHANLSQAYMAAGNVTRAVDAAARTLELREMPLTRALFAKHLQFIQFKEDNSGRFRRLVLRALSEGWNRPRTLTGACISLIKLNPTIADWIARSNAAWPDRLLPGELLSSSLPAALAADRLLIGLLKCDPVNDIDLERLLTNLRHALLHALSQIAVSQETLPQIGSESAAEMQLDFSCTLATQCFINEYVFSQTDTEAELAQQLRASLEAALAAQGPLPPLWLAIAGAYRPLHKLANAQSLLTRQWPPSVETLIARQVKEPAQERELASTIPALTEIDDEVSRLVRQQYEENPYPRWSTADPSERTAILATRAPLHGGGALIAGCGTGLGAIEFAREARHVRILAIDLSLGSLSYAKRMAVSLGVTNVEFAQADINKLGSIGRNFDFIDASGVLHHLADPWVGWRVLLSLLRPGGTMQVCLYSALARQNVVAGRALIAERGYRPIPEDIRRCREAIIAAADNPLLKSLSRIDDFFSASECRDMLFHVQEHQITLPEIKSFIAENNLQFTGFNLDQPALQRFAARFPQPSALLDLDCWHRYELEAPNTFLGMYQFWIRKPAVL